MADCLISPAQEIGKCILTQCLWPPIKSHFNYWWCFDSNIQGLEDGIEQLEQKKHSVEQEIEGARLGLEVVRPWVDEWLKASTKKLEEAQKILLPRDNNPKAWNLISRYSMGKNAKKTVEEIAKHLNNGNFDLIADPPPPASMASLPRKSTSNIESRKHIEEEIIDSLKDRSVGMIGICGMGGVGKTTMAERIRERVKNETLFDEVVMVTVGRQKGVAEIQQEIAEWLKLQFDERLMETRASKLYRRLMDTKRKLIILDDVWESLKLDKLESLLHKLGVPSESERESCKILFTARSTDICQKMKAQKIIIMKILTDEEAWILFKEKVGNCVEDPNLVSVAKDVVSECNGLPVALVTIGKALQNKEKFIWEDYLFQLRGANPTGLPEVLAYVYKPLKLSYDDLDNDSLKYLFLLCCLFPENHNIPLEQLTWYGMTLSLFRDTTNIKQARNRTYTLVDKLKSRFLLIGGKDKLHVKMHVVVRDVAIYIGSEVNKGFLKSLHRTSTEISSYVDCNWLSVDISNERMEVPVLSRFPKLQLLMLRSNEDYDISRISFKGIEGLNVLSSQSSSIGSLPPTLESLENLQTLCLVNCKVENISVVGKLTSLKILSCNGCGNIMELPAEIGRLNGLRLLELNGCYNLQIIPFGIISRLFLLEELKIRESFSEWEAEEYGKERRNASLRELECLPDLSCLEIEIDDCALSAQDICLSQKLVKYYIRIGSDNEYYFEERDYEKVMILNLPSAVGNWIRLLARNAESLSLKGDGSDNINLAEMENLRNLDFRKCSTVKKLVDTSYLNQNVSLCNLKSIYICECSDLKHVFSVSVARKCLLQLEVFEILNCESMEQVFWNEVTDDNTGGCIEFPKLKKLRLFNLPNLRAFCQGLENIIIKFPNLTEMEIDRLTKLNSLFPLNSETVDDHTTSSLHFVCNPKVEMGRLKVLRLLDLGDNVRNIWCHQIPDNVFTNLEELFISSINGIRSLMSTSIAKNLVSLKFLHIEYCKEMVEVIKRDDDDDDEQVLDIYCLFPTLRKLRIWWLDKLRRFWQWNHSLELPFLQEVDIYHCPVIETFTLGSINTPNIREIEVNSIKIDDQKDLNDAIRQYNRNQSQNKDKGKNEGVDEEGNEDKNEK